MLILVAVIAVIALSWSATLLVTDTNRSIAHQVVALITFAVVLLGLFLMREALAAQQREARLERDRAALASAYGELERAKALADAKASQLEATLASMSDGVMLLDQDLRVVQWNERFTQITGVPASAVRIGVTMEDILRAQARAGEFGPVDVEAEVARRISNLRRSRTIGAVERSRPNGRTMEARRSALPGGGFVTLYTDITARKQIEAAQAAARHAAEEAAEQKSRFVAIVSHEIRTPLNAVLNSVTLLDQSDLSADQRRYAETARQAGDALLALVNDILELSKMEAGRLTVRANEFALRPLLEGVRDMFRDDAARRALEIVVDLGAEVPEVIRADAQRIRQVLMNFVSNAVKFSIPGRITIAACVVAARQPSLRLGVRDSGPRIPDAEMPQLFQPFSRLAQARDVGAPGTGLGLAICDHLAALMGGSIGVGAAPSGDGSAGNEFWLVLPLERGASTAAAAEHLASSRPRRRRGYILLVEDMPANQLVASTLLRRDGHRVEVVASGADALRLVRREPFDLVLMDLQLPGASGYEAAHAIRALPDPAGSVPIVALTANVAPEDRLRCLTVGMNDVLAKPLSVDELDRVLVRMLARRAPDASPSTAASDARPARRPALVLDDERVTELGRNLPPDILTRLMEQCLADLRGRVPLLQEALRARDDVAIQEAAHALAGMSATYGLAALETRMRDILDQPHDDDETYSAALAEVVEAELGRAEAAIRSRLRAQAA